MADLRVHDPDRGVHDRPIGVFTLDRNAHFKRFLGEAGLPAPICQHRIDLGAGYGGTIPDFFYAGQDDDEPGICIYLDGMAGHIHGNPEQAEKDRAIRAKLGSLGYEVIVVRSFELDDKGAVVRAIARIAKYLVGKEKQKAVRSDTSWFDRVEAGEASTAPASAPPGAPAAMPLRIVDPAPGERYVTCVPLIPLRAAAGAFSDPQHIEEDGFEWVAVESHHRLQRGMFVAHVVGRSMEPAIPDGAWCLFRTPVEGSRQGRTVLVQLRDSADPETGQRYTVKRYRSEKVAAGDSWRHTTITLEPLNPDFEPIVLSGVDEGELQVVAELVDVIGSGVDGER